MAEMADGILELASELRRLRLERGAPTYENLARRANVSRSTVADAFSGTKNPSERTLFGIVSALGDAPEPWLVRRAEIVAGGQDQGADATGDQEPDAQSSSIEEGLTEPGRIEGAPPAERSGAHTGSSAVSGDQAGFAEIGDGDTEPAPATSTSSDKVSVKGRARARRSVSVALLVPLLVVAALAGAGLSRVLWPAQIIEVAAPDSAVGAGGTEFVVEDGANIWDTGCIYDAIKPGADRAGDFDTLLGLRVSLRCKTIWGVLYRNDGGGFGNQIRLLVYPKTEADPGTPQEILVSDQDYAVTAMILQEDLATDQYCVEAWITQDGVEVSLGEPLCA